MHVEARDAIHKRSDQAMKWLCTAAIVTIALLGNGGAEMPSSRT